MDWRFIFLLLQSASEEWFKEDKCAGIYWKGVLEKKVVVLKRLTINLEKSFAVANFFLPLQPATQVKGEWKREMWVEVDLKRGRDC